MERLCFDQYGHPYYGKSKGTNDMKYLTNRTKEVESFLCFKLLKKLDSFLRLITVAEYGCKGYFEGYISMRSKCLFEMAFRNYQKFENRLCSSSFSELFQPLLEMLNILYRASFCLGTHFTSFKALLV